MCVWQTEILSTCSRCRRSQGMTTGAQTLQRHAAGALMKKYSVNEKQVPTGNLGNQMFVPYFLEQGVRHGSRVRTTSLAFYRGVTGFDIDL